MKKIDQNELINDIFKNLSKQNINVSGLRNTQSRLETLFVDITKNNKVDRV